MSVNPVVLGVGLIALVEVALGVLLSVSLSMVDVLAGCEVLSWVVKGNKVALWVLLSVSLSKVDVLAACEVLSWVVKGEELTTWPVGGRYVALVVVLTTLVELATWDVGRDDALFDDVEGIVDSFSEIGQCGQL